MLADCLPWLPSGVVLAPTFDGRDLFAPAAARLAAELHLPKVSTRGTPA